MNESMERQWGLTAAQRAELWARRKAGESLTAIGRALGKQEGSIFMLVMAQGGIAPAPRRRARRAVTAVEREQISRGLAAAQSIRAIARELGRPASTISREVTRHGAIGEQP